LVEKGRDRLAELEERYAGYEVYDRRGEKIGKVDDLFVDENDELEYIGVRRGTLGKRITLVPMEAVRVGEGRRVIEVSEPESRVREGPSVGNAEEVTPEYEKRVRTHYGLEGRRRVAQRDSDGDYRGDEDTADSRSAAAGATEGELDRERGLDPERDRDRERRDDLEDEIRMQRSEEELRVGTREREAGTVNVRKRVTTDREQLRAPNRREEARVDRAPLEGRRKSSEDEIGEDEVVVPAAEEEVVTEKRPVVKEEIRVCKDAVQDEEVVEEDVRKERGRYRRRDRASWSPRAWDERR